MVFSSRKSDIMRFKQILEMFEHGLHRTQEGLVTIVKLAYGMNHDGKQRKRPIQDVIDRILRGHTPDAVSYTHLTLPTICSV